MVVCKINNIEFKLKEFQDFTWLNKYGNAFFVIDETGSGCISFGIENSSGKYFYKIAGAKTVGAEVSEVESINLLREAVENYKIIKHENLIKYVESFDYDNFFVVVYEYVEGECLFDHWNFDKYNKNKSIITPIMKYKSLPIEERLDVVEKLFSFFETFIDLGYIAVDFYDSSIIYDFDKNRVIFCDIDLFKKGIIYNLQGVDYYGTKRLKAPEENELNSIIDEKTNEFTLGAIIFDMFSNCQNIEERYKKGTFIPNNLEDFELSSKFYEILLKATNYSKEERYDTIKNFHREWNFQIKNGVIKGNNI